MLGTFFSELRQKLFDWRLNYEIFDRIFPHLLRERNWGYEFKTEEEVCSCTLALDAQLALAKIEEQATRMPDAYRKAFRYVMHRNLQAELKKYELAARRRTRP